MIEYKGKHNTATIMLTDYSQVDQVTMMQIVGFLDHPDFASRPIVIMPDCHAGAGSCIGFTQPVGDVICPAVIGVDIGCGMLATKLKVRVDDFQLLDNIIRAHIPSGFGINSEFHNSSIKRRAEYLRLAKKVGQGEDRTIGSLGTLGGANHFIEVDEDEGGNHWLVIHSGSRDLGLRTAQYHQGLACGLERNRTGRKELAGLPIDEGGEDYLEDMRLCHHYAQQNRALIAQRILYHLGRRADDQFDTVHNYISEKDNVIRKGAVSAHEGERLIIPLNMRDGIIVGVGKGNDSWNKSAPHGAGRIMSSTQARAELSLAEFRNTMKDVWSTSVSRNTLDEAPGAYKPKEVILNEIGDTIDIQFMMKPVYNFKAD